VTNPLNGQVVLIKKFSPLMASAMYYIKQDLAMFDIELPDMNDLHEALKGLTGAKVEIRTTADLNSFTVDILRVISR